MTLGEPCVGGERGAAERAVSQLGVAVAAPGEVVVPLATGTDGPPPAQPTGARGSARPLHPAWPSDGGGGGGGDGYGGAPTVGMSSPRATEPTPYAWRGPPAVEEEEAVTGAEGPPTVGMGSPCVRGPPVVVEEAATPDAEPRSRIRPAMEKRFGGGREVGREEALATRGGGGERGRRQRIGARRRAALNAGAGVATGGGSGRGGAGLVEREEKEPATQQGGTDAGCRQAPQICNDVRASCRPTRLRWEPVATQKPTPGGTNRPAAGGRRCRGAIPNLSAGVRVGLTRDASGRARGTPDAQRICACRSVGGIFGDETTAACIRLDRRMDAR
uniref:Uncharacterized protein n=1 Tax=Setaria viridis TaxID=4556 RepID=A0A4U6VD64_SETVI|nr:hypothetical protein SEVIR_3G255300v2 [Setaria viridis]